MVDINLVCRTFLWERLPGRGRLLLKILTDEVKDRLFTLGRQLIPCSLVTTDDTTNTVGLLESNIDQDTQPGTFATATNQTNNSEDDQESWISYTIREALWCYTRH